MRLIRVNMTTKSICTEDVPVEYAGLGGRGLTSVMINNDVPAGCDPLGPKNRLIFAPGYLTGNVDKEGGYIASSLEYETIWSMGGMIGNGDLDTIAKLDFLCDDIGLDTMSTGAAIAVAMDAGYKQFGDAEATTPW